MKVDFVKKAAIFITDITSAMGTVVDKVYTDDIVLVSCASDATAITVAVLALTGNTHLKPVVTVNGIAVTNLALDTNKRWAGSAAITVSGSSPYQITATHEDCGDYVTVMTAAAGPTATVSFTGGYPGTQTELKEADVFNISVSPSAAIDQIEIQDFEASQYQLHAVTPGTGPFVGPVVIAARGSGTVTNQRVKVRCRGTNGIWGAMATSNGVGDGSGYVILNNDCPTISAIAQGNISYPASQAAIKGSESATVNHTVTVPSGSVAVAYTSPNGDLSITNPSTYEPAKSVTRISGSYNISANNLLITATKVTNAAVATRTAVVYVANAAAQITVALPAARLRSGGNYGTSAQNHVITINSNQSLYAAPTLVAPAGTWQGGGFAGGPAAWTRSLQVHDDNTKGTYSWGALVATNLAGTVTSAITGTETYILGGFVFRTLTVAAWPNRETAIGTYVANTAKLGLGGVAKCTNLSKGDSGSLNDDFQAAITDGADKFTITDPTGIYNAGGNLWYNCDLANAVSNTSGLQQIEIEEVA